MRSSKPTEFLLFVFVPQCFNRLRAWTNVQHRSALNSGQQQNGYTYVRQLMVPQSVVEEPKLLCPEVADEKRGPLAQSLLQRVLANVLQQ